MFSSIYLDSEKFLSYKINEEKWLDNISKINIFIGANNSGKSRFMRKIFIEHDSPRILSIIDIHYINGIIEGIIKKASNHNGADRMLYYMQTPLQQVKKLNKNNTFSHLVLLSKFLNIMKEQFGLLHNIRPIEKQTFAFLEEKRKVVDSFLEKIDYMSKNSIRMYIPILRGLRPLQLINPSFHNNTPFFTTRDDNYSQRCVKDYFASQPKYESIFTGLSLFEDVQKLLLGDTAQRRKIREFEIFLSETFFDNEDVNIVPRLNEDVLHIKIGSIEKPIYELGDGIQSIIILTYPLFFNLDKYAVFYYEEPELHLHPGLQRIFIDTLRRKEFDKFQYFLTTHSNHFLDLTLDYSDDISVYTFKKKQGNEKNSYFEIQNVTSADSNVLDLLGVRNSSVFLSNCTIWVEGITDRLYLRKYLSLYQKDNRQFKEDLHYSFVEYGGNNINHWSFLDSENEKYSNIDVERLCGKLFLVTDRDKTGKADENNNPEKDAKLERHEKLAAKLKERYYCLKAKEIENILSPEVIKKTILSYKNKASKADFSKFDGTDYSAQYLGKFIDDNVGNLNGKFASPSGTITDKVNFCKKAIEQIETFDDLSEEAKELTKKIYEFIAKNNS